MQKKRSKYCK